MRTLTRRKFVAEVAATLGLATVSADLVLATDKLSKSQWMSPFRVAVITDEITQDFEHACSVASREFGMQWVELRGMWDKNLMNLTPAEIAEAQRILRKYELRVTDIASPLFKVGWP